MKVAISGASGFIGSHLVQTALAKGWAVTRISQELLYSPKDLEIFFNKEQPDYIWHLASFGNMSHQKDVPMTVFANIIGTFNMLNASKDVNYRAFVNFGSSSEYGKKFRPMQEEEHILPTSFYGASKAGATHLAYAFAKHYDKPIFTIRPFSVYGPGEAAFRFIPTVIRSLKNGTSFVLDEEAYHDWIFISDFIDGLFLAQDKVGTLDSRVINCGTGRQRTNKEIVKMLEKISGKKALYIPMPNQRPGISEVWMANTDKLTRLGWYPKVMTEEGLRACYEE